eukprot:6091725-Prymnesium_polylepis.1
MRRSCRLRAPRRSDCREGLRTPRCPEWLHVVLRRRCAHASPTCVCDAAEGCYHHGSAQSAHDELEKVS